MMRALLALPLLFTATLAKAEPQRLSMEQALNIAIDKNPRLSSVRERALGEESMRDSAAGRMLPSLEVTDQYQHWNKPFVAPFGGGLTVRDLNTNTLVVSASQPLLGLLSRSADHSAQARSAEAAQAGVQSSASELRQTLATLYLRLFEARAMKGVADLGVEELEERVNIAQVQLQAGAITNSDVLRVQVALGEAKQTTIQAEVHVTVSRAQLLATMGLPPDDVSVDFAEPTELLAAAESTPAGTLSDALSNRPELQRADLEVKAAREKERATFYKLLPEIDAEAAYQRIDGQAFMPPNSAFVGIRAKWAIWEWNSGLEQHKAAAHQEAAARSDAEALRQDAMVELTSRRAELGAAKSAVSLAEETLVSAEEAYRVTVAGVDAGTNTVTDLLDSQSTLTRARLNLTQARYERAVAYVNLEHALGTR